MMLELILSMSRHTISIWTSHVLFLSPWPTTTTMNRYSKTFYESDCFRDNSSRSLWLQFCFLSCFQWLTSHCPKKTVCNDFSRRFNVVDTNLRIDCSCQVCAEKRQVLVSRRKRALLQPKVIRKYILLAIGWIIVGYMSYKIATTKVENTIWDPYAVLGISSSAPLDQIKSHYKKLSRSLHPDKIKLVGNMTKEGVESLFVNVTKAYKAYFLVWDV